MRLAVLMVHRRAWPSKASIPGRWPCPSLASLPVPKSAASHVLTTPPCRHPAASPTVFVVLAGGLAAGSERPRLVLRAESPSARNKWVEAVWAAIEGPHGDVPGLKDAALALPRTLALESTEGAELDAPVGTGVDRKISTRVFDEAELRGGGAPAEEGAEAQAHKTEEGEGRGEPGSPGRTLSQQSHDEWAACPGAAQSAIAPEERAVLQAVLPVVRTYVHETCLQLASQVSKVRGGEGGGGGRQNVGHEFYGGVYCTG